MALATLSIDIVAQLSKMQEGMDKAGRIAERNAAQIEASFSKLRGTASAIGGALAGAFAGVSVVAFVKANVDALDALNDLKDATGASIENLSALEDIARRNGGTLDDVSGILVKFNGALKEADGKNGVSQALQAIGLNAAELKRMDPAEALRQTAVALAGFADDGSKARIVQELFGKSIREAGPYLKDLAEAGGLNATVTAKQAEEAERFNKQLFAFQTNLSNAARGIVSEMLPALSKFGQALAALPQFRALNLAGTASTQALAELETAVSKLEQLQEALDKSPGGNRAYEQRIKELKAEIPALQKAAEKANESLKALTGPVGHRPLNEGGGKIIVPKLGDLGGKPILPKPIKTQAIVYDQPEMPESLKDALKLIQSTDVEKVRELKAQLTELITLKEAGQGGPGLETAMQTLQDQILAFTPAQQAANEEVARFNALLAATPTSQTEAAQADMLLLAKAFEAGQISVEQFTEAVQTRLGTLPQDVAPAVEQISEFTKQFAHNVQDAIGDTVLSTLKGDFDNIGQLWADMLLKMSAQAIAADIGNALFGPSAGGGGAGFFAKLFANAKGNAFMGGYPVQAFASGGVVGSPTLFGMAGGNLGLMGEAGPEAIMPLKRGRNGKLGVAASGGVAAIHVGQGQVINVGQGVSRAEVYGAVRQANAATLGQVRRLVSTGRLGA